jgi:putative pyoverdin transport system ATP-binding/permease protein
MKLISLLARQAGQSAWNRLMLLTLVGGLLTTLVVTVVNAATGAELKVHSWQYAIVSALLIAGMYLTNRSSTRQIIEIFEHTNADLRRRFAAHVRGAPLRSIETLGARLNHAIGDLAYLASTLESWVSGLRQVAFIICTTLSVALISRSALILWCVALGLIGGYLRSRLQVIRAEFAHVSDQSAVLGGKVEQLIDGFIQAKLDHRVAASLASDIEQASKALYARQTKVENIKARAFIGSFATMYVIGSGAAVFSSLGKMYFTSAEAYELVIFFEMVWAPLFGVLMAAPEIARAEASTEAILHIVDNLPQEPEADPYDQPSFGMLELDGVEFSYAGARDERGFSVGPLNLTIRRGDLVLVTGGNGSGKTTLLKTLMGLYVPDHGRLLVDGLPVTERRRPNWRNRFTTIMSHQHLFDRLYGLQNIDADRVTNWIERLGLTGITAYSDGRFTNLALSTGQKMRLAMVVAMLEDRPICVFDEWTANQDPESTHWYYDTLLPELLAAGKTVIAVSHDKRFFERADHCVIMAGGRILEEERRASNEKIHADAPSL